jgi:hypothetical protein
MLSERRDYLTHHKHQVRLLGHLNSLQPGGNNKSRSGEPHSGPSLFGDGSPVPGKDPSVCHEVLLPTKLCKKLRILRFPVVGRFLLVTGCKPKKTHAREHEIDSTEHRADSLAHPPV